MSHLYQDHHNLFEQRLREALRGSATSVAVLSTRDQDGGFHGLAITAAVPLPSPRPSIIVAINHTASAYPVIRDSGVFCLNQITSKDVDLLDSFCQSDFRASRFTVGTWHAGIFDLPYLVSATANYFCRVQGDFLYDDKTIFVGRIEGVRLGGSEQNNQCDPLIWVNGGPARLAAGEYA